MGQIDLVFLRDLLWGMEGIMIVYKNLCLIQGLCGEIQFDSVNQCGPIYSLGYVIFPFPFIYPLSLQLFKI